MTVSTCGYHDRRMDVNAESLKHYKAFCEWFHANPHLDLDPRLHTCAGPAEHGGYISNQTTRTVFYAWVAGAREEAAKHE